MKQNREDSRGSTGRCKKLIGLANGWNSQDHQLWDGTPGIVNLTDFWQTGGMKHKTPSYQRHRFPSEIISHAVWLYHRFCLSFREVEEFLAQRGLTMAQAIRRA